MAKQTINQGTAPTGAGGDTFRSGSAKLQANDDEIYSQLGATAQGVLPAALPINKGGTGATTAAAARTNLGLGKVQDTPDSDKSVSDALILKPLRIYSMTGNLTPMQWGYGQQLCYVRPVDGFSASGHLINIRTRELDNGVQILIPDSSNPSPDFRRWAGGAWSDWIKWYTSGNTTVDANGFIKAASPIIQLFADHIKLNDEAEQQEITFEKLGVGDYLIKGSSGFAQEGWYIETPKDANGNVLVAVIYEQLENGDINVKTYDYMLNNKGRIVADTETPLDIPDGRWIDLRLQELPQPEIEVTDDPEQ